MGLLILNVAWMQNECLLSIVSENWTHIFKSRKSEKPCMDYWAKKLGKIALKHVQNTFGQFWDRFWAFLEFWFFLFFFWKISRARPSMQHGAVFFPKNCHKTCPKQVWTILGTILGIFAMLNFFWFFRKLSMNPWNNEQKTFPKKSPQDTFGQ